MNPHPTVVPPSGTVKFPVSFGGTIFGRKKWAVETAMVWLRQMMLDTLRQFMVRSVEFAWYRWFRGSPMRDLECLGPV